MAGGSKTEKATPKRKSDERKKGNVFQSQDIISAFSIFILFFALKLLSQYLYIYMGNTIRSYIGKLGEYHTLTVSDAAAVMRDFALTVVLMAGPLLLVALLVAILLSGVQTRFLFAGEPLRFKFSRINPLQGFKRFFSVRSVVELFKSLVKITLVGVVLYGEISKRVTELPSLLEIDLLQGIIYIGNSVISMIFTIALLFLGLSVLDYVYQWWEYERNLRMSKQEVKEEFKQLEGDPKIKAQIKEKQRQMAQMRMMQQVPAADVVIRNPTHYAVAIRYAPSENRAPVVVAKGVDLVALRIVTIAQENEVSVTENVPLARALYAAVDINAEIPADFYQAVAEVLAFVYTLKKKDLNIK